MRHRVTGRKFGRPRDQRRLLLRNLVKALIEHGRLNTTLAKAKEIQSLAERLITYGKKGTVHHRRLAYRVLNNRDLVKKLFEEMAPEYAERNGGYTRVLKNGFRQGDCAPMAIIEFIREETAEKKKEPAKKTSGKK